MTDSSPKRPGRGVLAITSLAVAGVALLAGCAPAAEPGPTTVETVLIDAEFDPNADAAGNYDWFLSDLREIAGGQVTRDEVLSAVSEATDAGWHTEATPGITTLSWVEADFVEVSVRDSNDMCLIGNVGFDGEVGATVAPVLESTDTCLLQAPTEEVAP